GGGVGGVGLDRNNPITLKRKELAPGGRGANALALGRGVEGNRPPPFELRQNRELGRAQPDRCQELIIKLTNVPSRRSDGEEVAILRFGQGLNWHCSFLKS